ncbi:hypothetical protein [Deinococcus kurensis]|uniref:hypothetical protein n=1 Tax=Deinococcus kurensis TaxID=2662757 RepID=UPI0012D2E208|nr:hypothetical protein [Deinococcus kurensis]
MEITLYRRVSGALTMEEILNGVIEIETPAHPPHTLICDEKEEPCCFIDPSLLSL